MRVLILGGNGMLGHKVWQVFNPIFDTWLTVRWSKERFEEIDLFDLTKMVDHVEATDFETIQRAVDAVNPDVIVNCIGIVRQMHQVENSVAPITVNALLPHRLQDLCITNGARLIHISTDCVFSGKKGKYEENDLPDAYDLYGRTKLLGEVTGKNCLTLRTSIIGRELERTVGLMEWFLAQKGKRIQGYKYAIFSGFTTKVIAEILAHIVSNHPSVSGLHHISSRPISKYDLLCLTRDTLGIDVEIEPYEGFYCDRSLNSDQLCGLINVTPPSWQTMIEDFGKEVPTYEEWRHKTQT